MHVLLWWFINKRELIISFDSLMDTGIVYRKKRFPPKVKPLTNDEYYEQGVRETTKALKDLRNYCNSPECKQWQIALKLKDVKR